MTSIDVKRIDHHGLVAGVIDDLQIHEIIDRCLPPNEPENVTFEEAVKAMIINLRRKRLFQVQPIPI